jgi:hypothetical protein
MESTPLLSSSQQSNSNNGSNRHGRTPSSGSAYYFLSKQGGADADNGVNVVEEMPAGAAEEEFAPRVLGPRVRMCVLFRRFRRFGSVLTRPLSARG